MNLLLLAALLSGCNNLEQEVQTTAEAQLSSGEVVLPTMDTPVVMGREGMIYLTCELADDGCFAPVNLFFAGTSPDLALNWDPATSTLAFGTFTPSSGELPTFVTKFPYPSSGRGNAAEPDAVNVDWETGEGADLGEEGLNDGWYNLPAESGVPNVQWVSDCGVYHPNIVFGWDENGDVSIPSNVASLGEDYCADDE